MLQGDARFIHARLSLCPHLRPVSCVNTTVKMICQYSETLIIGSDLGQSKSGQMISHYQYEQII